MYDPPTVGNTFAGGVIGSYDDFWENAGGTWTLFRFPNGNPAGNFGARFSAIPEASTVSYAILGGLILSGISGFQAVFDKAFLVSKKHLSRFRFLRVGIEDFNPLFVSTFQAGFEKASVTERGQLLPSHESALMRPYRDEAVSDDLEYVPCCFSLLDTSRRWRRFQTGSKAVLEPHSEQVPRSG